MTKMNNKMTKTLYENCPVNSFQSAQSNDTKCYIILNENYITTDVFNYLLFKHYFFMYIIARQMINK